MRFVRGRELHILRAVLSCGSGNHNVIHRGAQYRVGAFEVSDFLIRRRFWLMVEARQKEFYQHIFSCHLSYFLAHKQQKVFRIVGAYTGSVASAFVLHPRPDI